MSNNKYINPIRPEDLEEVDYDVCLSMAIKHKENGNVYFCILDQKISQSTIKKLAEHKIFAEFGGGDFHFRICEGDGEYFNPYYINFNI